jgi:hypothetical protein
MLNLDIIADAIVAKLLTISQDRAICEDDLRPDLCGYNAFDAAVKIARRNHPIQSRIHDGTLWFRGLGQ